MYSSTSVYYSKLLVHARGSLHMYHQYVFIIVLLCSSFFCTTLFTLLWVTVFLAPSIPVNQ